MSQLSVSQSGLWWLVFCCLLSTNVSALPQDDGSPVIAASSNDAELALRGFVVPEQLQASLVAAEPLLANPVAFTVTRDGRVIVCETFRQEKGVEDNRAHMNWLEADLQLETAEERAAMFRRFRGADVAAWSKEQDRLRMLQDTDGDGRADVETVLAAGFHDLLDGTGAGVLEHNGTVYYTCIPNLWAIRDTDGNGVADETQVLHHGYGVRVAFRGHDLHGLTLGPEGRIYFSIGDRGFNVITPEGKRIKFVDTGAVFRCDPDGSHLEVFAHGLRNPQELAFDDDGNLFTGDNNSDGGDKARWVYVVRNSDTGWRMYYQYLEDRGPWNRERIWYPYRSDDETSVVQPAGILPPVSHLGDGPSGLTYDPGIGLEDRYRGHFFLADFRGSAGNSGIRSFALTPNGATFALTDSHQFIWSILATDLDFAPDGSLYVSDWVNGWNGEGKGRLYRFAATTDAAREAGERSKRLLAAQWSEVAEEELIRYLSDADRRVRQQAQFELVRRDRNSLLIRIATSSSGTVAARQAAFGCWQAGLSNPDAAGEVISAFTASLSDESATQRTESKSLMIRILSDLVTRHGLSALSEEFRDQLSGALVKCVASDEPRLVGFAAAALGQIGRYEHSVTLLAALDRNNNSDPVVRHQAVMGLVSLGERHPGMLPELAAHAVAPGRLGVLLAMRRQGDVSLSRFLTDPEPQLVTEAARAINDDGIDSENGKLASLMEQPGLDEATLRRALNAGYRLGTAQHASLVAAVAARARTPKPVRLMAVRLIESWNTPQQTDAVTGRWRPLPTREVDGLDDAVRDHLPGILAGSSELREAGIRIASQLGIEDIVPTLQAMWQDMSTDPSVRVAAFRALTRLSKSPQVVIEAGLGDPDESVRLAAVEIATIREPHLAVPRLRELLKAPSLAAQQTALRLLGPIRTTDAETELLTGFERLQNGQLAPGAILDLVTAAETRGTDRLKHAVEEFRNRQQQSQNPLDAWSDCVEGGNASNGREIFFGRGTASCRRCHRVAGSGSDVGPDLSEIGKDKDRNYLLQAIVDPNAKIAKGFETVILVTADGLVHTGILKSEDDTVIRLITSTGAPVTVLKADVEERANGTSGMPQDLIKNLTRLEIRDLVEYLTTLRDKSGTAHGH